MAECKIQRYPEGEVFKSIPWWMTREKTKRWTLSEKMLLELMWNLQKIAKKIRKELEQHWLSHEIIDKIIRRKFIIVWKSPNGDIWSGTWDAISINWTTMISTAKHVLTGVWDKNVFKGEIVEVIWLNGKRYKIKKIHINTTSDTWLVFLKTPPKDAYEIKPKITLKWKKIIMVWLRYSEYIVTVENSKVLWVIESFTKRILWILMSPKEKRKYSRLIIIPNDSQSWNSWSIVTDQFLNTMGTVAIGIHYLGNITYIEPISEIYEAYMTYLEIEKKISSLANSCNIEDYR